VAVTSIGLAMAVGGALGLVAGYVGGAWDNGINRVMGVFFSISGLLLAVGVAAMRGPGVNSAVVAITIVYTPLFVRVMRAPVLAEREKEYVEAVRALGARMNPSASRSPEPTDKGVSCRLRPSGRRLRRSVHQSS
jgi:peptide/nickel transport system permease protein